MNCYFLNLDIRNGGLSGVESSSLARTFVFSDFLKIKPIFVTTIYNPNLHKNKNHLISNNRASSKIEVLNMYDYFQSSINLDFKESKLTITEFTNFKSIDIQDSPDARLYDHRGKYFAYCKRTSDTLSIEYINYISTEPSINVWRRETYDCRGFLSKVDLLEKRDDGSELGFETYFRPNGTPAIIKKTSIRDGIASILLIQILDENGRLFHHCLTEEDLIRYWLEIIDNIQVQNIYIIDRAANYHDQLVSAINKNGTNSKIVNLIHAVHTVGNVFTGEINPSYKSVLENPHKSNAIVVLTEQQKQDIESRYPKHNIHVIPHSLSVDKSDNKRAVKNYLKIVYLARFAIEKNHEAALNVFQKVVSNIPNAELHLYGFGDRKESIKFLIKEKGLQNSVFVNDHVYNVSPIYQEAGLSILTSMVEGFCLGVLESLWNSCPVVSFDIKYGPSSMIKDGENGFLIPNMDINMMADKIIDILNNKELHQKLIDQSHASVSFYSNKNVANRWDNLLKSLNF